MNIIKVENVSVHYIMPNDKVQSLKEYIIKLFQGKMKYNLFQALKNVSFSVEKGQVIGIIGHNGAGKSTLLKAVAGIIKPQEGKITVNGTIVPMLELGSGFDNDLSGKENIYLNGAILGYSEKFLKEKYNEIVEFSELNEFIDTAIRNYSSGMLMRLAFSIAAVVNPDILIVDEILSVGDANFQEKSKKRMMEMMHGGTTVLFVSHSLEQVRELCNQVLWIDHGQLKMYGEAQKICDEYEKANMTSGQVYYPKE